MNKILVVEDDSALAIGIEFALSAEKFNVSVAKNLKQAEKNFSEYDFNLILLDVMLPDGSGYEFCKKVRKISNIPVIFLTACDEEVNIVMGLDIGADDYITKPFRIKELISRINAALRRSQLSENVENKNCIVSKDIILHPLQTKVFKNEREILLTPIEYKLLNIFMSNPLQTITREVILQKLWDVQGEFVDDNTLSVYIRRLREKLEDNPSKPEYIVTIRGIGYRWNFDT